MLHGSDETMIDAMPIYVMMACMCGRVCVCVDVSQKLCSARTNMAFFFREGVDGVLLPTVDYPTDKNGPLLSIEQIETAFVGAQSEKVML